MKATRDTQKFVNSITSFGKSFKASSLRYVGFFNKNTLSFLCPKVLDFLKEFCISKMNSYYFAIFQVYEIMELFKS